MPSAIKVELSEWKSSFTLDVSAQMYTIEQGNIDCSANSILYVSAADLGNVFMFQTDASENVASAFTELKFFTDAQYWYDNISPNTLPCNALVYGNAIANSAVDGTEYPANKREVVHDFIRYLSDSLFNTPYGVDLFSNELELIQNIRAQTQKEVWDVSSNTTTTIGQILRSYDKTLPMDPGVAATQLTHQFDGMYYSVPQDNDSKDTARVIMENMMSQDPGRFNSLVLNSDRPQPFPFVDGDQLEFSLQINPADGQADLIPSATPFGGRTYKITIQVGTTSNPGVSSDEVSTGTNKASKAGMA